jgi:sugar phosphate isomerase/epimerase
MPLGAGDLDLPGVLGAPDARGFRGWLTVELDDTGAIRRARLE